MDNKKPNRKNSQDPAFKHLDMETVNAASSMDFTGMIPANPQTEEELESYEEMYDFGNDAADEMIEE